MAQDASCPELKGYFGTQLLSESVRMNTQSYGKAKDYLGNEIKLQADIYQANVNWFADQLKERPLIVLYHGGGFKANGRNGGIMKLIATYYAQRGYVAVSADYRIGWNQSDATALCGAGEQKDYLDAQYRAMQDERMLVRYFKSQANTIKFDSNRIFLMGISSGATLVCSRLEDEWISNQDDRLARLGPLESHEINQQYSTEIAGILSFAGANLTPEISADYRTPIAFFHGTCDNAVPYKEQYLAGCTNMGYYYGPGILTAGLAAQGVCFQNYVYCGFGHDLAAQGDQDRPLPWALQDVFEKSIHFMQSVMCNKCEQKVEIPNRGIDIQPLASCDQVIASDICAEVLAPQEQLLTLVPTLFHREFTAYVHSNLKTSQGVFIRIYDMGGRLVQSIPLQVSAAVQIQKIQLKPLNKGVYLYQITDGRKVLSNGKLWSM